MGNIRLFLKANDRIFINGAVLKADRKVSMELLNNATFLLENHVLQEDDANSPVKQLYFIAQLLLIDPSNAENTRILFRTMVSDVLLNIENAALASGIKEADVELSCGRILQGLKILRKLFSLEKECLQQQAPINLDTDIIPQMISTK